MSENQKTLLQQALDMLEEQALHIEAPMLPAGEELLKRIRAAISQQVEPAPAQDDREAIEVVAYLIRRQDDHNIRGVRLHVDRSCYDARTETLDLMTVAQHERIVAALTRHAQTEQQHVVLEGWRAGVEAVAAMFEKKADDYAAEFGHIDMGELSFGVGHRADIKRDHHSSLVKLAEEVRTMLAAPIAQTEQQPVATWMGTDWNAQQQLIAHLCKLEPGTDLYAAPIAQTAPRCEQPDAFEVARHSKRLVEQLRAENTRLKAECEQLSETVMGQERVIEDLEPDARRYRTLRQMHWNDGPLAVVADPKASVKLGADCPRGERLDQMLDQIDEQRYPR